MDFHNTLWLQHHMEIKTIKIAQPNWLSPCHCKSQIWWGTIEEQTTAGQHLYAYPLIVLDYITHWENPFITTTQAKKKKKKESSKHIVNQDAQMSVAQ